MSTVTGATARPPDPAKVNQVLKWVLAGSTAQDIREAVEHHFPGEDSQGLLAAVMIGLEQTARFTPDVVIGWCFESCRDLYRRMVEAADYAGALRAVKMMADLAVNHVPSAEPESDGDRGEAEGPSVREKEAGTGPP